MYKFDAINLTLGLNYLRVSPDHGVAINLIGKNKASENSLLQCIKFINKYG
jgi:4-hydroxythreonine-4-phosphate dehydrogenase